MEKVKKSHEVHLSSEATDAKSGSKSTQLLNNKQNPSKNVNLNPHSFK